jgi:hypothetical protein
MQSALAMHMHMLHHVTAGFHCHAAARVQSSSAHYTACYHATMRIEQLQGANAACAQFAADVMPEHACE